MRIAQVSPLYESVPPRLYGGTERVVSYLTEELAALGHEVTLFASGDSKTAASLAPACARALRLDPDCRDHLAPHMTMIEEVCERLGEFDVVHWHIDYLHYPSSKRVRYPHVTTLHGRLDLPELGPLYRHFADVPLVSISMSQRTPLPPVNWAGNVYHGIPPGVHELRGGGEYLVIVGRISPEKRVDRAIEIAKRCGLPLKIAAKIDRADEDYFGAEIKHLLDHPLVEYVGEVDEAQRDELVGGARAFLFPIDWPEPFGMVMIESMAVGTPVIAWRNGSVPEVIDEGVSGYIVDSIDAAVEAVGKCGSLDRKDVRAAFERRFSSRRMAQDYLDIYARIATSIKGDEPAAHYTGAGAGDHPA